MIRMRKLMLDTLADISLLLSFTPNTRMHRIGSFHGSLKLVNAFRRPIYDTVETIAAKRTPNDC
jgi:hypothetical protein